MTPDDTGSHQHHFCTENVASLVVCCICGQDIFKEVDRLAKEHSLELYLNGD